MVSKSTSLLLLLVIGLMISGCVGSSRLTRHLNEKQTSLAFIRESKPFRGEKKYSIYVDNVKIAQGLSDHGQVYTLKTVPVPLIVFNYWKQQFEYRPGKQQIREDIGEFTRLAAINEINRSTSFAADKDVENNLKLMIEFNKIESRGPYQTEGFFLYAVYFALWSNTQKAGPASCTTSISYKLMDGDRIVLDKSTSQLVDLKPIMMRTSPFREFRKGYCTNMIEQLSVSIKNNIEVMGRDIESFLQTYQPAVTGSVPAP